MQWYDSRHSKLVEALWVNALLRETGISLMIISGEYVLK